MSPGRAWLTSRLEYADRRRIYAPNNTFVYVWRRKTGRSAWSGRPTSESDQGGDIQTSGQVRQRRGDYGQLLAPKPTSVLLSTQSGPAERGVAIVFTPRYGRSCVLTTTDRTSVLCTVEIPAPRVPKRAEHGRAAWSDLPRPNTTVDSSVFCQKWIKNEILEKDKKTTTAS